MDDLISKQDALDAIARVGLLKSDTKEVQAVAECLRKVEKLQPVKQETVTEFADRCRECGKMRTGHWITHGEQFNALGIAIKGGVKCSECGYTTHNKLHMEFGCPYKFCPNCGARMIEERSEQ